MGRQERSIEIETGEVKAADGGRAVDDPAAGVLTDYPGDRATGRVDIRERNVEPSRPTPQEAKGGRGHE